ncbi:MAG: ABC transporter ATP-binding protein [Nitrososphaerota archaeon]|jgi:ABC-type lipoprotein export system ATPase subunit|nr:ABC transporter ATP-binding protein [Nitrososphaerota archaeon]MDG6960623.1 ABC transporter ATP-binding protein [Nitrososphaerota archaeon]MDG6987472.1 ABC transporter ATP-binding protein [Nitrososphaerota archaeon]MDG7015006.1 ABC transporter ATP-binding protein [Nitrososphaerota archaeon]MDG7020292.1 ABC transporter ATP-binding protein [Nitrososphaerota archaeon]
MTTDQALALEDVWKAYPEGSQVLRGVSLSVAPGEFVGIFGRSGSGKSTLLRIMGLLDRPSKGTVKVLGAEASKLDDPSVASLRREKLGYIFQGFNLIPHITALENIEVPMWLAGVRGQERRERALADLKHFGLDGLAGRYPREMSHGEQQRVAAIRAMANRPGVILADEPTSSLDDESARVFIELVSRFNRELGTTVVMVSTSEEEARAAAAVYRLSSGTLARV